MLRLEIYQETAHFRIPTIGMPYLSYPLPPPSTIYGFLRAITDYESINYQNTKLSIQGYFKSVSFEKEQLLLQTKKELKTNIIPIQKLHQCRWIIHINSPFEEKIKSGIENGSKILRLGRKEDMIIDIDIKQVEEKSFYKWENSLKEDTKIYKTWKSDEDINGSLFKMALDTEVDENKKIIGYKPINLIYLNAKNLKKSAKIFDGEYLVEML
jgi:CRISPR-associated protein Cas5t